MKHGVDSIMKPAFQGPAVERSPAIAEPALGDDRRWRQIIEWSSLAAMVYPVLFVLLFTVAGVLRPGYSPLSQAVSDLGVGPMAWLVDGGLIVLGLVMIAPAIPFFETMQPKMGPTLRWTCAILIALPGVGFLVGGVFTEAPSTVLIHWLVGATLGLYLPLITFLVVGLALMRQPAWRWYGALSLVSAIAAVAAIVFVQLAFTPGAPLFDLRVGGLAERVDLVVILSWYMLMGWGLFQTTRTHHEVRIPERGVNG